MDQPTSLEVNYFIPCYNVLYIANRLRVSELFLTHCTII